MKIPHEKRKTNMTVNERIEAWFAGREDEYVSALAPLIAIDSTTGTPEHG